MATSYFDLPPGPVLSLGRLVVKDESVDTHEEYFRKLTEEHKEGKFEGCRGMAYARNGNCFVHYSIFDTPEQVHAFIMENRADVSPIMGEVTEEVDLKFFPAEGWS